MQLIYQRGGNVASSQFDLSLLEPVEEKNNDFESQLIPINENEQDPGVYLDNLSQPEGFFKKLPRNILIGLSKLGHSTINFPHDITSLIENKLSNISNEIGKSVPGHFQKYKNIKLSDYIPKQENYNFSELLGQPDEGTLMDKLIQGGIEYLPLMAGGAGLLRGAARRLIGTHQLNAVEKAAKAFGENNFSYSPEIINEAKKYLPNTEATRQLLSKSMSGEYPASYSLRSQLGKYQRDLSGSPLASERLLAPEIGDLRKSMLSELDNSLRNQGMHVEADMLKTGIKNYRQYMRVKEAVMPVIKKLGIPTTIAASIGFGYKKGKNFVKD